MGGGNMAYEATPLSTVSDEHTHSEPRGQSKLEKR